MTAPMEYPGADDFPNYVWVGFCRDTGEPKAVQPVKPHGDYGGDLDWKIYFPADFMKKHSNPPPGREE